MEHIIPDKFIRMCRLLEITSFPVHWKFEEKDHQIVVTFIWNIGSSEVFSPHQATPKTESTVAIDSKKDSEIPKEDSASDSKHSASHHSVLKSETSTKDASSTDKRRSKSKSSSRTTSPAASTEERKSITAKRKEKSADSKDRLLDTRCEKTNNISKHKNCSNNANVCLETIHGSKGSDGPKPQQESSTKHRHSSSNSEKKYKISSSKDAINDMGKSSIRSCSDQEHRHSSSNSEKKHTISSSKDANSEKGQSSVRSCSDQEHRHSSSNSEKKHTISSSKDANSEKGQSSVRSCSDQKHRHSSSNSEKKHTISSSKDAISEKERSNVLSCIDQKHRHSSSKSEKKHTISSSKDAISDNEQSNVRSCGDQKHRHSSSNSEKKHTISSSKDAISEKERSNVLSCSDQKHRHSSFNSEKKHTISSSKDAIIDNEQSNVRSCGDQKHRHSSSKSEKKHTISSSKDAISDNEQSNIRSCGDQKHRHSSSNSEKKHTISSSKDANSEKGQSSVRSCSDQKHRHFSSKSSSKVQLKSTAEQEIGSYLEVNIQTDMGTDACGDTTIPKPQNESVLFLTSDVKHNESGHKESSLRKEHKSNDSNSHNDKNHKKTHVRDEKKCRESTSLNAKRHVKLSSRDQGKPTEPSLRHDTQSRRERPKDKNPRREKSQKDSSSRREETQEGVTANAPRANIRNESHSEPPCERTLKEPSLRSVKSVEESRCEQLSKESIALCEQSVKASLKQPSALCEQERREEAHKASIIRSDQIIVGSHCSTVPKITATGSEQMGKQKSKTASASCEKTTKELSSRCEPKDSQCNETLEKSHKIVNSRDSTSRREKTSKETISENNKNPKTSKTKNTMEGVVSSRDRNKQPKKHSVGTQEESQSKDTENSSGEHRIREGGRNSQEKAADSQSSGLSRGKRRKDCIQDERPKKLKMDIDVKPLSQCKEVKPLGQSTENSNSSKLPDSVDQTHNEESPEVPSILTPPEISPRPDTKDSTGSIDEVSPKDPILKIPTEISTRPDTEDSTGQTDEVSPKDPILKIPTEISTRLDTEDSTGPTDEVSPKDPILKIPTKISPRPDTKDSSSNKVSPDEPNILNPSEISQKPDTKDSVPDTPRGSTTLFPKNDLWEMFVNRCKVKTNVQFSDQPVKESDVKSASVDPDPEIGSAKDTQSITKDDQNSKIKQSTEKNKKHSEIPPKDRKEDQSKPTRKSSTHSQLNKSGSTSHQVKTKTAESKLSSTPSTENISIPKKPSMESTEKNQPSRLSNNGKITLPVPEVTSTEQDTKSKECIINMERVMKSKVIREDVDLTFVDVAEAVTDSSEDTGEHPKELNLYDPVDSDDDDGFNELQIDLEHDDSKSNEYEEEQSLMDKEDSQLHTCITPSTQEPNSEMTKTPTHAISPVEAKSDIAQINVIPHIGKTDPVLTVTDDAKENTSQDITTSTEQIGTFEEHQKISSENGLPKNTLQEEGIGKNDPEKREINSEISGKNETSNNQQEKEDIVRDKLNKKDISSHKQENANKFSNKLEKEEIHSILANNEPEETKICYNELQQRGSFGTEGYTIINNDQENEEIHENDLEEGEIEAEDEERDTSTEVDQNEDKNVIPDETVFDNILLACSPVSSIEPQIDEEPFEGLERNGPCAGVSRSQTPSPTQCQVGSRTGSSTTSSPTEGVQTPSSIYSYQTEDLDGVSRASTPLLDEMNNLEVPEVPGFRTVLLPESEFLKKQVKSEVRIPDRKKRRKKKNKSTNQSLEPDLMDIFQGEKLSKRKRRHFLKQLRKQFSEPPDSHYENMKVEIQKEQRRRLRANRAAELWTEPKARGTREPPTNKKRHVTDWDNLLQQHIHEMKRPKSKDAKTEDLNKKIDNFLIEIDLKNNKNCPNTFLPPNQIYKETTKVQRPLKIPKQVNFGNLIDVQSYTSVNDETSIDEHEQFDHDSLMDSIIISSTRQENPQEKTPKKRKRHTDDSDSESDQDQDADPKTRMFHRSTSRSLPRMNRDIAIQQRNSPDTGLHQYLFLYEDSRPCTWIDSDEILEHNPHFYNSLKKCFVPKEGSQEQSEMQKKLYNLVGFPS